MWQLYQTGSFWDGWICRSHCRIRYCRSIEIYSHRYVSCHPLCFCKVRQFPAVVQKKSLVVPFHVPRDLVRSVLLPANRRNKHQFPAQEGVWTVDAMFLQILFHTNFSTGCPAKSSFSDLSSAKRHTGKDIPSGLPQQGKDRNP